MCPHRAWWYQYVNALLSLHFHLNLVSYWLPYSSKSLLICTPRWSLKWTSVFNKTGNHKCSWHTSASCSRPSMFHFPSRPWNDSSFCFMIISHFSMLSILSWKLSWFPMFSSLSRTFNWKWRKISGLKKKTKTKKYINTVQWQYLLLFWQKKLFIRQLI